MERLYTGVCSVTEQQKYEKANKSTGFRDVVVLENVPCRRSYSNVHSGNPGDSYTAIDQTIKVFLAPELEIKPGSRLTIVQDGRTEVYRSSGKPAVYQTHQEISLGLWKERA